jgi:origin recognition complex subunit 5
LGPKPFQLDRMLALFASLYAEHAERPDDLAAAYGSDDDEDTEDLGAYPSAAQLQARAERRLLRDREKQDKWDDEVDHLTMSVKLWAMIPELEGQGILRRMSPPDRLDNVVLRCEVDYETAKTLAKELRFSLDEYLYEANN